MKTAVFEGKVMDDIIRAAINYFHQDQQYFKIDILEEKRGFLGLGAFIKAKVTLTIDPLDEGKKYLAEMLQHFGLDGEVFATQERSSLCFNLETANNGLLIGKEGKTLRSIQYLTTAVVNNFSDDHLNVLVDIGGYKQKQNKRLELLAKRVAKETLLAKVDAKLDPMNSYERRIIHNILSDWEHIKTVSEGTNPNRHVVIKYVR